MKTGIAPEPTYPDSPRPDDVDLPDRFMEKVNHDPETGCWRWTGATVESGYGRFWSGNDDDGVTNAHRWVFKHLFEDPGEDHVHHICQNPGCVNPWHLESLTPKTHIHKGPQSPESTGLCRRGLHEWVPENIIEEANGARRCRPCRNAWSRSQTDGVAPGKRTHCPEGHPYDEENTYTKPSGQRECRACHRQRQRERWREKHGEPTDQGPVSRTHRLDAPWSCPECPYEGDWWPSIIVHARSVHGLELQRTPEGIRIEGES